MPRSPFRRPRPTAAPTTHAAAAAAADPPRNGLLARIADVAYRRRGRVLAAWVAVLAIAVGLGGAFGGEYAEDYSTPGSESKAAQELVAGAFGGRAAETIDVVWTAEGGASAARERVEAFAAAAGALPGIGAPEGAQLSPDGGVGILRLLIDGRDAAAVPEASAHALIERAEALGAKGVRVELGGQAIAAAQQAEGGSEMAGLLVAVAVLALTFGTVVAAGLPLLTALFGLGVTTALIGLLTRIVDTPDWSTQVATMIGLGVGIDYALLILTRFRAELDAGLEPRAAVARAVATAGRSVLVAGTTVVISVLGLFLMALPYLYGVALSSSLAVLVVMAASVTLLPAALGYAGTRVDRLRIPLAGRRSPAAAVTPAVRWSRAVQRRPWVAALAGGAVLLVLAAPVTDLRLGFPDAGNDRAGTTSRQAYDLTAAGFGAGANGPLVLAARAPEARMRDVAAAVAADPGVAAVSAPAVAPGGAAAMLTVQPATAPQAPATEELVHRLREEVLPRTGADVLVGGATASVIDQSETTAARLPLFIGGVVSLSFLLLLAAFRAPVVAAKAGLMNLVSIAAAYGVVALVAEGGWAGQLVGIDTATPVPPFIPVMMFAILFGLSMDYEVFLLSRVREEYLRHGDTSRAVADGLAKTARVITAAAAIMVAVFGAFALSPEVFLKLIGIGLATAILVDATVVRMVLVPAVMQLLGRANWWLPRWLDRALPRLDVEGAPASAAA